MFSGVLVKFSIIGHLERRRRSDFIVKFEKTSNLLVPVIFKNYVFEVFRSKVFFNVGLRYLRRTTDRELNDLRDTTIEPTDLRSI